MSSDDLAWTLYFPNKIYCDHPQCSASAAHIVVQVGIGFDAEDFAKLVDTPIYTVQNLAHYLPNAKPEVRVTVVCKQHELEIKEGRH